MLNESSLNAKYDEMSERLARLKQVAIDNGIILADQVQKKALNLQISLISCKMISVMEVMMVLLVIWCITLPCGMVVAT